MNQVRHGDFSVVSDISGCEEVNQLKECFMIPQALPQVHETEES